MNYTRHTKAELIEEIKIAKHNYNVMVERNEIGCNNWTRMSGEYEKTIQRMAEYISTLDIDGDICRHVEHCNTTKCADCIIKYFSEVNR